MVTHDRSNKKRRWGHRCRRRNGGAMGYSQARGKMEMRTHTPKEQKMERQGEGGRKRGTGERERNADRRKNEDTKRRQGNGQNRGGMD